VDTYESTLSFLGKDLRKPLSLKATQSSISSQTADHTSGDSLMSEASRSTYMHGHGQMHHTSEAGNDEMK
jgi:hypothetical protein